MTNDQTVTQADERAADEWYPDRSATMHRKLAKLLARHRTAHSGESRSNGAGEDALSQGLASQVAEAMEDDRGFWRSCTGCHETNEGHSTGAFPYSNALKCELGAGCHECGGLGAIWDNADYADMADFVLAADRDHENVKRILIENGIEPYRANQITMAITELKIPAALSAPQGEVERLRAALIECGRAAGAYLADDVSNDFLMLVPKEVHLRIGQLADACAPDDAALAQPEAGGER